MAVFGRRATIQFGRAGQAGKSISGLRVGFRVEHTRSATPSKAVIEVYNLSWESIGLLEADDARVRLLVGYDAPHMVFTGSPVKRGVVTRQQGPDRVTRIEAEDGGSTWRTSRVEINIVGATTFQAVLSEVLTQMGLPKGSVRTDLTGELSQGLTYVGPARDLLDRLADSTASDWMVRDGAFVLLPRGAASGETAVVFSSTARNLVGSPAKTDKGVEVTGLIVPQLRPAQQFRVEASRNAGTYIADAVAFHGDTHGQPWYVIAEGRPA